MLAFGTRKRGASVESKSVLKRQTRAKHTLLRLYLPVWGKILGRRNDRLFYVDGFSYRGEYKTDEDGGVGGLGSPIIAMRCLQDATADLPDPPTVHYYFVEKDPENAHALRERVAKEAARYDHRVVVQVIEGDFDAEMPAVLRTLERAASAGKPIPAFFFVDPYGHKCGSMGLNKRVLSLPMTELFINLMWIRTPYSMSKEDTEASFDSVMGTPGWRELRKLEGKRKSAAYLELYLERLAARDGGGAEISRSFELRDSSGNLAYWLVFATNSGKGWHEMKRAMWSVDSSGGFTFSDTTQRNEQVLFKKTPSFRRLKSEVRTFIQDNQPVDSSVVRDHVLRNTPYLTSHIIEHALKPLLNEGVLKVVRPAGRRRGYADGTMLSIQAAPPPQPSQLSLI